MRLYALLLITTSIGCLEADLVECSDGRTCPGGTVCDEANATCVDPHGVSVPQGAIDFASVGCGTTSEIVIPLRNYGLSPITFEARSTISGISVRPEEATIEPGASLDLTVTAVPAAQSIPGVSVEGTLVISTDVALVERPIRMTTVGALATVSTALNFGEAGLAQVRTQGLSVKNEGNAALEFTVVIDGPSVFSLPNTTLAGLRVAPGDTHTVSVAFTPPAIDTWNAQAILSFEGALCQPPVTSVGLEGIGSGDSLLVDHTVLDFGVVGCGTPLATLPLVLTNNDAKPQSLAMSLLTGTGDFGAPATAEVGEGPTTTTLQITRAAIPVESNVGARIADLVINATPSMTSKQIRLQHVVAGPVLKLGELSGVVAVEEPALELGTIGNGGSKSKIVTLSNSGNTIANVTISPASIDGGHGSRLTVSPNPLQLGPGESAPITFRVTGGDRDTMFRDRFSFAAAGQCGRSPVININAIIDASQPGEVEIFQEQP